MDDDRTARMERLVEQALALSPEERTTFIDKECGKDEKLHREVTSLLEYENQAFDFLQDFSKNIVWPSLAELSGGVVDEKDKIDTFIKHYHIIQKLGIGGMGVVYKAHDTRLDRMVALKFLPAHLTIEENNKQRFIREARAAAALNHPNICTVYSIEEYEGQKFIAMEYIDGQTLQQELNIHKPEPEKALQYAIQIAGALAEAHEKGTTHRDIKPGNIMIDSRGRIKVMDFGLAKMKDDRTITQSGTRIGTAAYMAPEQIRGHPVDHRTDLYSFGVVLFEMLTGEHPFQEQDDITLSFTIVNHDPPLLSDLRPDLPQDLSRLVNRLLEKDPNKRYSSTETLAGDLKTCMEELKKLSPVSSSKAMDRAAFSSLKSVSSRQQNTGTNESKDTSSASYTLNLPTLRSVMGLAGLAGGVIILLLIGYWLVSVFRSPAAPPGNRLAVLPLVSISQAPEDVQFTDGIHEELINRLAGIGDLTIIARRSVLGYPPGQRNLREIGKQLGVSSLMDGTVRKYDNRVRVSVQLIDVNSLATIWSGSFEENIDDIFAIQSSIARQVAGQLHASLTQQERERLEERPTESPLAYLLYMRGQEYLSRYGIEENLLAARQLFSEAVEEDPGFAQAWAMLTHTYCWLYWFYGNSPEHLERMKETAERAQLLNPNLPKTQLALGMYYYWSDTNHQTTLTHFKKALQSFPNQPMLHYMTALTYRRLGNWELLIHHLNKTLVLDPLSAGIYTEFSWDYWMMRDYEKAGIYLNRMKELKLDKELSYHWYARLQLSKDGTLEGFEKWWNDIEPEDPVIAEPRWWGEYNTKKRNWAEAIRGYRNVGEELVENTQAQYLLRDYLIGLCLEFQGNQTEAQSYYEQVKKRLEDLRDVSPDEPRYRAELGKVYARLGEMEKAIHEGEKATELMPVSLNADIGPRFEMVLAEIYTWTGHEEQAIDKLEYLLSIPSRVHRNDLRLDPIWDPLRDHPRFQALITERDESYLEVL